MIWTKVHRKRKTYNRVGIIADRKLKQNVVDITRLSKKIRNKIHFRKTNSKQVHKHPK